MAEIQNVGSLANNVSLKIGNGGVLKVTSGYAGGGSFAGKDVNIQAGGRLEVKDAWRSASFADILAGDKANGVKGGTLSVSFFTPGWGADNNITLSDNFYGILEVAHGGLAITSGMKLGGTYQISLASDAAGDGNKDYNGQPVQPGAFLVFGDTRTLDTEVSISANKFGSVTVKGSANVGTINKLVGAGTLVLSGYMDESNVGTFEGKLQLADLSEFTGSIDVRQGNLALTGAAYTTGAGAVLKTADGTSLSTAANLTIGNASGTQTTGHQLSGNLTVNGGAGSLIIQNADVTFGKGESATNTLDVANITVKTGGVFRVQHATADYSGISVTLDGGKFFGQDMTAGSVVNFGALQVDSASEIDYEYGSSLTFTTLSGAGDLHIFKGSRGESGTTTIGEMRDYTGLLNTTDSWNADANDDYKVYINKVTQSGSNAATITGKTFSSAAFTKAGDGSVTFDTHTAEAGFTVEAGKVTIGTALNVTGATNVTAGELAFNSGAAFTGTGITVTGGKLTLASATTLTGQTVTLDPGKEGNSHISKWVSGHTGAVVISSGNISINGNDSFSSLTVNSGARVDFSGTYSGNMTLAGTDPVQADRWYGSLCMGGSSELAGALTIAPVGASITLWSSNSATLSGTVSLGGTLYLGGYDTNWYGTLKVANAVTGAGDVVVNRGTLTLTTKAATKDDKGEITKPATSGAISNTGDVKITSDGGMTLESGTSINKTSGAVKVEGGKLTVNKGASFTAQKLLVSGGTASFETPVTLGKLTMTDGTLSLGGAITGLDGFSISQTGGEITLSADVLAALDATQVAGTSNGWGINKYALVVPASGTSLSLGSGVMVSVNGSQHELGTDGTLDIAATSGNYYIVNGAGVFYGTGTTGIDTATKIVLAGGGLNYNASSSVDHDVALEVQQSGVIALNETNVVLEASRVTFAEGTEARLHGVGSYVISGTPSSANLNFNDGNSEWTGTVVMDGAQLSNTKLDDFVSKKDGVATSSVELKGASGSLASGSHAANVIVTNENTLSGSGVELSGKMSGQGDLKLSNATYGLSGDVSKWTGSVKTTGASEVAFTGSATTVNANLQGGTTSADKLSVTFSNDEAVQVNGKISGNTDVVFDGSGTKTVSNSLNDYTGTTLIAGGSVVLTDPSSLGQSDVLVGAGALLDVSNLSTVDFTSLVLDGSATIVLSSGVLEFSADEATIAFNTSPLLAMDDIALLSGSTGYTTIDLSNWDAAVLSRSEFVLFDNVSALQSTAGSASLLSSEPVTVQLVYGDTKAFYDVKLVNGQVVASATNDGQVLVPEPTTATLSLLALTALAARRRRK